MNCISNAFADNLMCLTEGQSKKHGSVPKLHTCSGPESQNEQKTPALEVSLQTELQFPPSQVRTAPLDRGGPAEQQKTDERRTVARSSSSDDDDFCSGA